MSARALPLDSAGTQLAPGTGRPHLRRACRPLAQPNSPPRSAGTAPRGAVVRYWLDSFREDWVIPEVPVPESAWHDGCLELLKALLVAWVGRTGRNTAVFRD